MTTDPAYEQAGYAKSKTGEDSYETLSAIGLVDSQYGVQQIQNYLEKTSEDFHSLQQAELLTSPLACEIIKGDSLVLQIAKGLAKAFFRAENSRDAATALKNLSQHYDMSRKSYSEATRNLINAAKVAADIARNFASGELSKGLMSSDQELVQSLHNEGLSDEEIVAVLGVPMLTVQEYLRREAVEVEVDVMRDDLAAHGVEAFMS